MGWVSSWVSDTRAASPTWTLVAQRLKRLQLERLRYRKQLSFGDLYDTHEQAFAPFGTFVDPISFALAIYCAPMLGDGVRPVLLGLVRWVADPSVAPKKMLARRLALFASLASVSSLMCASVVAAPVGGPTLAASLAASLSTLHRFNRRRG